MIRMVAAAYDAEPANECRHKSREPRAAAQAAEQQLEAYTSLLLADMGRAVAVSGRRFLFIPAWVKRWAQRPGRYRLADLDQSDGKSLYVQSAHLTGGDHVAVSDHHQP
jgi:hypothetical protein